MINLTSNNFKTEILDNLSVVKIWASWCGPCKAYNPIFEDLTTQFSNVKFFSFQVDQSEENQDFTQTLGVKAIPTVLIYKNGQEIDRIVGLKSKAQLIEILQKYL